MHPASGALSCLRHPLTPCTRSPCDLQLWAQATPDLVRLASNRDSDAWGVLRTALAGLPVDGVLVALELLLGTRPASRVAQYAVVVLGMTAQRCDAAGDAWRGALDALEGLPQRSLAGAADPVATARDWARAWAKALPDLLRAVAGAERPLQAALEQGLESVAADVVVDALRPLLRARPAGDGARYAVQVLARLATRCQSSEAVEWRGVLEHVVGLRGPQVGPRWYAAVGDALGSVAFSGRTVSVEGVRWVCEMLHDPRATPDCLLGPAWALACMALHNAPAVLLQDDRQSRTAFAAALVPLAVPEHTAEGFSTHQCAAIAAGLLAGSNRQRAEAVRLGALRPLLRWGVAGGGVGLQQERAEEVLTALYNLCLEPASGARLASALHEHAPGLLESYAAHGSPKCRYFARAVSLVLDLPHAHPQREALPPPQCFATAPRACHGWSARLQALLDTAVETVGRVVHKRTREFADFADHCTDLHFRLATAAAAAIPRLVKAVWEQDNTAGPAAWALGKLLQDEDDEIIHYHVALAGGVPALLALLRARHNDDDARAFATFAAANLAGHPAHRPALAGAVPDLVRVLGLDVHPLAVKEDAALALEQLAARAPLAEGIVSAGAVPLLERLVQDHCSPRAQQALEALRECRPVPDCP